MLVAISIGPIVATAVLMRSEQDQVAGDNFCPILFRAALTVFPTRCLKLAFDVQFGALLNVLTDDLRQTLPGHDVVPLGPLLPLVASIFVLFVGG
jgi:hypothetical protein